VEITKDIILDLLPLYFSGEASKDTVVLVEKFFAGHPEFAAEAQKLKTNLFPNEIPVTLTQEDEMKALRKTRSLIRQRSIFRAIAIFFSLLPFSFVASSERGLIMWVIRDYSGAAIVFGSIALICWIGFFVVRQRLSVTAL